MIGSGLAAAVGIRLDTCVVPVRNFGQVVDPRAELVCAPPHIALMPLLRIAITIVRTVPGLDVHEGRSSSKQNLAVYSGICLHTTMLKGPLPRCMWEFG